MLQALEEIKTHAEEMLEWARIEGGVAEKYCVALIERIDHIINVHKAATEESSNPANSHPELPAGYPPITPTEPTQG